MSQLDLYLAMLIVRLPVGHKGRCKGKQFGKEVVREEECAHAGPPSQATQIAQRTRSNTPKHIIRHRIGRDGILRGRFNLQETQKGC